MSNFRTSDENIPSENTPPVPEATACKKCRAIAIHRLKPGVPPHAWGLWCACCDAFVQWYSAKSREERESQRVFHRTTALLAKPPTLKQMSYLSVLGFSGVVSSCLSASQAIDALLQQGRGEQ